MRLGGMPCHSICIQMCIRDRAEKGQPADFATVLADIRQRDYQDSHRAVAPLRQADDAILVDTSSIGPVSYTHLPCRRRPR